MDVTCSPQSCDRSIDQRQQTEGVRAPARGPVLHVTFDSLYATAVTGLRLDYVPQTADLCSLHVTSKVSRGCYT